MHSNGKTTRWGWFEKLAEEDCIFYENAYPAIIVYSPINAI